MNRVAACLASLAMFVLGHAYAQETISQQTQPPATPAGLSLESLYHPKHKIDFDGQLPTVHWVDREQSQLLVRRDDVWNVVDLTSGAESPLRVAEQLRERLAALEGIEAEEAKSAANSAVGQLKSLSDTILVPVGKSLALVSAEREARWLTRDATTWHDATLDPSVRRVAYTRDGDLYIWSVADGRQVQLTNDGLETLLDGRLDWIYQEEIFGRGNYRAFWFSPDGDWLAMLRIDTSLVEKYTLGSSTSERGQGTVSRYPKAGDPIPHATLLLWDLRGIDSGSVPPPRVLAQSTPHDERIFTGVWWNPHQRALFYCISDRKQTWRELRAMDLQTVQQGQNEARLLLREESPAWVEPPAGPAWLNDGSFVWRSEVPSGRTRLYHVSHQGQLVIPLTPDQFDVRDFMVSPSGAFALVTGDSQRGTIGQQVYRISFPTDEPTLLRLTERDGWHAATFSPDGKWFVDEFSTANSPPSLAVQTTDGQHRFELAQTKLSLDGKLLPPEFFQITTPDQLMLPAMLVRPEQRADRRVPVLIEVYGGPQAPTVADRWMGVRTLYRELLARQGIATLLVDNRSSAGRGLVDTWSIRGRMGEIEFQDLMTAVQWLQAQPWVATDRIAIRGWSFGGFLTVYAMTHSQAFAAGIAGGSVTDWREYDAFYTERYMGLPNENPDGYRATAPIHAADQLHGSLLLIHGESDDNVHPSGSLRLAQALQDAGKDFRLMIYPDEAHAVHQPGRLWHLALMTDRFLKEQLRPEAAPSNSR